MNVRQNKESHVSIRPVRGVGGQHGDVAVGETGFPQLVIYSVLQIYKYNTKLNFYSVVQIYRKQNLE